MNGTLSHSEGLNLYPRGTKSILFCPFDCSSSGGEWSEQKDGGREREVKRGDYWGGGLNLTEADKKKYYLCAACLSIGLPLER